MSDSTHLRIQCAAITNGCMNALVLPGAPHGFDALPEERRAEAVLGMHGDLLAMNGWHLDHGRWVCGAHERTAPNEHQYADGRLRPDPRQAEYERYAYGKPGIRL